MKRPIRSKSAKRSKEKTSFSKLDRTIGLLLLALLIVGLASSKMVIPKSLELQTQSKASVVSPLSEFIPSIVPPLPEPPKLAKLYPSLSRSQHQFDAQQDNLIEGPEGIQVNIPKGTFESNEVLTLSMKECLSKSDMTFSHLSTTTTDGQMLESGGMVHLEVKNGRGEIVEMASGKNIELRFPKQGHKDGMKLFDGKEVNGNVEWVEQQTSQTEIEVNYDVIVFTLTEVMPEFPGGEHAMYRFLSQTIKYPQYANDRGIEGIVYTNFLIDTNGRIMNPRILRGVHPLLDATALLTILKMPNWIAGTQRDVKVPVQFNLPIRFKSGGFPDPSFSLSDDYSKELAELEAEIEELEEQLDLNALQRNAEYREEVANFEAGGEISESAAYRMQYESDYYIMSSNQLGWINCDRYLNKNRNLVNSRIHMDKEIISAKLIFKNINSVIAARHFQETPVFSNMPLGESVWLYVTKMQDGKPYVAFMDTRVQESWSDLEFELFTQAKAEEIRQMIANPIL